MKWKKDNKLPNTKNVKKKNADGSVQITPGTGKKGKRGGNKKQQQQITQSTQSEVKVEMFKDDDFHALL
jgi:N-acetyl-beta-hexosaminidase